MQYPHLVHGGAPRGRARVPGGLGRNPHRVAKTLARVPHRILAVLAHQFVAGLLREVLFHRNIYPYVFTWTGNHELQPAAQPRARARDEPGIVFERAGRVNAQALAEKVDFKLAGIQRLAGFGGNVLA